MNNKNKRCVICDWCVISADTLDDRKFITDDHGEPVCTVCASAIGEALGEFEVEYGFDDKAPGEPVEGEDTQVAGIPTTPQDRPVRSNLGLLEAIYGEGEDV